MVALSDSAASEAGPAQGGGCAHCASPTPAGSRFCCAGCENVHALLRDEGLARYYDLRGGAGVPIPTEKTALVDDKWIDLAELELAAKPGLAPVQLDLEGLHCTGCVWLCEELFRRTGKPGRAVVNPALGTLDLWVERDFPLRDYVGHLASFGYRAGPRKRESRRESDLVVRMGVCIALAMNTMIFSISLYAGLDDEGGSLRTLFHYLNLALALGAFWVGGSLFVRGAWRALRRGMLHLDLPIALGLVLGYAGSIASLVFERGEHAYFDTLVIFTALMLVGRYLRERVLEKNRAQLLEDAGIEGLLVRRFVEHAEGGASVEVVPVTQLARGDRLLLAPGDVAPVDARLVDAEASLSLEWITGESVPLAVSRDALVTAGASNAGASAITVEATQAFEASGLVELLRVPRAVDRYGDVSTPFEAKLSRVWVLAVLAASALGFVAWWLATGSLSQALAVTVGILVVTCPCAFGIATPIAHEVVLGGLRKSGLLVRSSSFLDKAIAVRRVVFDKTGTLTTGGLVLADAASLEALEPTQARILYDLAARSSHPKAAAVKAALPAAAQRLSSELVVEEHAGRGLSTTIDGRLYRLGSPAWLGASRGDIAFAVDDEVLAELRTEERLRPDAAREVDALVADGLEVWMLTGDQRERALAVAKATGIDERRVVADQSPEEKAAFLAGLDRGDTLMIGDGINDGPAVRAATCSGTPAAGRAFLAARTDFYLLTTGLAPVRRALLGAHALRAALRRNLGFALFYNVLAVGVALSGHMSPLVAAVLMPLSSIASIALALRSLAPWRRGAPSSLRLARRPPEGGGAERGRGAEPATSPSLATAPSVAFAERSQPWTS